MNFFIFIFIVKNAFFKTKNKKINFKTLYKKETVKETLIFLKLILYIAISTKIVYFKLNLIF